MNQLWVVIVIKSKLGLNRNAVRIMKTQIGNTAPWGHDITRLKCISQFTITTTRSAETGRETQSELKGLFKFHTFYSKWIELLFRKVGFLLCFGTFTWWAALVGAQYPVPTIHPLTMYESEDVWIFIPSTPVESMGYSNMEGVSV